MANVVPINGYFEELASLEWSAVNRLGRAASWLRESVGRSPSVEKIETERLKFPSRIRARREVEVETVMHERKYKTNATQIYDGPDFEEFCISEGRYLPASRD